MREQGCVIVMRSPHNLASPPFSARKGARPGCLSGHRLHIVSELPECCAFVHALAHIKHQWHQYVAHSDNIRPAVYVHALALVVSVPRRYVGIL